MPDFFIDRIVRLKSPTKDVFKLIQEKEKFGGGSIRDISRLDTRGGNAVNIAYCLAKLGVHVTLFTNANEGVVLCSVQTYVFILFIFF
jgi:ribokinase